MLLKLLILFIVLPLLDLWLLFTLADGIASFGVSFGVTIGLIVGTGIVGAHLARRQGLAAWQNFHSELNRGTLPADTMLDGVLILLAGAVLITPGLITDAVGLALLVPPIRRFVRTRLVNRLMSKIQIHPVASPHYPGDTDPNHPVDATVIDAEFQRHDDDAVH